MARGRHSQPYMGPRRSCLGCRAARSPSELVRLVLRGGRVTVDSTRTLGGRGAYVCCNEACTAKAIKQLGRAFRSAPGVSGSELWRLVSTASSIDRS